MDWLDERTIARKIAALKSKLKLISAKAIKDAVEELKEKSDRDIEKETAIKWGARHLAARLMSSRNPDNFKHESLEHASMVDEEFVVQIMREIGIVEEDGNS